MLQPLMADGATESSAAEPRESESRLISGSCASSSINMEIG